jgi:hypothetical protein
MVTVSFSGFWKGFDPGSSIFMDLLKFTTSREVQVVPKQSRQESSIEFHSVFQFRNSIDKALCYMQGKFDQEKWTNYLNKSKYGYVSRLRESQAIRIWYSGENLRSPHTEFDLCLGYDQSDEDLNVQYFPVWYLNFNWPFQVPKPTRWEFSLFTKQRDLAPRLRNACVFSSYVDPARTRLIEAVRQALPVSYFGAAWGNFVTNKQLISRNFGFQVCPENDIYPGYLTEKLFESYLAGCIPIWTGNDVSGLINPRAFLDVTGLRSREIIDLLGSLSEEEILVMRNEPLLKRQPDMNPIHSALRRVIQ